jgi:PAS domain S-box-containing protein
MGTKIDSTKISSPLSKIQKRLEDIRARCISDPDNAEEILPEVLKQLQVVSQDLSAADEELTLQNEELLSAQKDLRESKRTVEKLQKAEERSCLLVKHAPSAIYEVDFRGPKFVSVNDMMCSMLGYSREELLAKNPLDLLEGESKKIFQERIRKYLAGEKLSDSVEYAVRAKDGNIIYGLVNISFTYEDGRPVGAVVVAHDITERKKIEEALLESEEKFKALSDASPAAIFVYSEGKILFVNEVAISLFGYTRDELITMDWIDLFHPDHRDMARRLAKTRIEGSEKPGRYQVKVITKAGEEKWLDVSANFICYQGFPAGIVNCMDITEHKRIEESLRQSRSMLAQAEKVGNIGSWKWDIRSGELIWSEQTYRIFGIEPEIFIPTYESFLACVHPDHRQLMVQAIESALLGNKPYDIEYQIATPNSTARWAHSRGEVVFDEKGQRISMVGTVLDITDRKKAEEALRESESKHRSIVEQSRDGISLVDESGCIIEWNPGMVAITGLMRDDVLGRHLWDVQFNLTPDEQRTHEVYEHIRALALDAIAIGQSPFLGKLAEWQIQRPDGTRLMIEEMISVILMKKGYMLCSILRDITERKRSEEALKESEERYRGLNETARDIIVLLSTDGKILSLNPAFETITGWSRVDWIGKHFAPIVHPDDLHIAVENFGYALKGENPGFEVRFIGKSGKHIPIEAVGSPQYMGGKIIGVQAIVRDITERKRMEMALLRSKDELEQRVEERTKELSEVNKKLEAINIKLIDEIKGHAKARAELQKSEEKYRTIVETAGEGIAITQPEGDYVYVNKQVADMLGYLVDDLLGKSSLDFAFDDQRPLILQARKDLYKGNKAHGELKFRRKDGSVMWSMYNASPVFNDKGEHVATVIMYTDITERKRIEDDLKRSEAKNKALLDAMPDAMFLISEDGTFLDFRADESELYVPPEKFIGKKIQDVMPPDLAQQSIHFVEQVKKTGELQVFEYQLPMAKGPTDYEARITLSGEDSFLAVTRNVTERKRSEKMLLRAKEAAEAALRIKSEFLAVMSHELRTPLNGILGMASLLAMENLSSDQQECVDIIRSSSESLLATINDILSFTSMENGKIELEKQPFNLKETVNDAVNLLSSKAKAKGLDITYSTDRSVPETIISDQMRLRQILVNLLDNAIKFTDNGRIDIFVSCRGLENDRQEIFFSIKDTGIGISQENIPKLFQPFSQVDMSTSRKYGGTGLGLSISKQIVELMGGKIWIKSEVGKGSIFYFTIISDEVDDRPLDNLELALQMKQEKRAVKSCRVLLAEDNNVNQAVTLRMLKKLGYTADAVASGRKAIESLKHQHYDLVLMDVQMPDTDGLEATKEIRNLWPDSGIKIIALTAYALEGDRERCIEAGMDGYIAKPVKIEDLAEALEKCRPEAP